jgi:protein-S-isoprenylcysteine O-methyltransferase Ste14
MHPDDPFRIALAIMLCVTAGIGGYRRFMANSGEAISHQAEGYAFFVLLRLAGLATFVSTLAYLLFPASVAWASVPLPTWLRWCGAVTGALGVMLMYWTLASLGKNLTDTVVTRARATLVTSGPYRWVQHPFYVTAALLMASASLLAANWLIAATSLSALALLAIRTPKEEQRLADRFGNDYRIYAAQTGRFLPRIGPSRSRD